MISYPKPLTDAFASSNLPPGKYCDLYGMLFVVRKTGSKYMEQRYTYNTCRRHIGLGPYPKLSLTQGRNQAIENLRLVRAGIDPIIERQRGPIPTFAQASTIVHDLRRASWSGPRMSIIWTRTLEIHVFPHIGDRLVTTLETPHFDSILQPMMRTQLPTAESVRYIVNIIMQWVYVSGFRPDNPAGERLTAGLPRTRRRKKHHRTIPHSQIAALVAALRGSDAYITHKLGLEMLILTALRSGEVREALWEEFDIDRAVWTIPAKRMKIRKVHRVPLCDRALAILREVRQLGDGQGLVFPSVRGGKLYAASFADLLCNLEFNAVPHGLRSTFRDWCAENAVPWYLAEACIAHQLPSPVERAYARSDLFQLRRSVMNEWAKYACSGTDSHL